MDGHCSCPIRAGKEKFDEQLTNHGPRGLSSNLTGVWLPLSSPFSLQTGSPCSISLTLPRPNVICDIHGDTSAPRTRADHRSRGAADDPLRSEKTPGGRVTIGQAKGPRGPSITSCAHDVGPVECCIALQLYSSSTVYTLNITHLWCGTCSGRLRVWPCRRFCLRPPRCVSTGPEVVRLAGRANERKRLPSIPPTFSQVPL